MLCTQAPLPADAGNSQLRRAASATIFATASADVKFSLPRSIRTE